MNNHENILILTALQLEAKPLARELNASNNSTSKKYLRYTDPTDRITIAVTGVGWHQATNIFAEELTHNIPDQVLIIGICGGLNPRLKAGNLHTPQQVITKELPPISATWKIKNAEGTLLTTQRILSTPVEKLETHDQYHADIVDMETYHLGKMCNERNIPFAMIRAVSDDCKTTLPPWLSTLTHVDGTANIRAAIKHLIRNPRSLPILLQMQQATKNATLNLSAKVAQLLADILK